MMFAKPVNGTQLTLSRVTIHADIENKTVIIPPMDISTGQVNRMFHADGIFGAVVLPSPGKGEPNAFTREVYFITEVRDTHLEPDTSVESLLRYTNCNVDVEFGSMYRDDARALLIALKNVQQAFNDCTKSWALPTRMIQAATKDEEHPLRNVRDGFFDIGTSVIENALACQGVTIDMMRELENTPANDEDQEDELADHYSYSDYADADTSP